MCWLIFAGVSGFRGDVSAVFEEHGLVAHPAGNPVCGAMDASATKLAISDGHCACALYLQPGHHELPDEEKLREKYRRKGWSPNKIASAVEARLVSEAMRLKKLADANPLPAVVTRLVENSARVSLLAHDFKGSFDKPFEIVGRENLSPAAFVARGGRFAADTLITMFGYVR